MDTSIEFSCDAPGNLRHKRTGEVSPFHMLTGAEARRVHAKMEFRKSPVSAHGTIRRLGLVNLAASYYIVRVSQLFLHQISHIASHLALGVLEQGGAHRSQVHTSDSDRLRLLARSR
jgi:hypothetical protein